MKKFFSKVNQVIKCSLPYTALLAVVLGVVNLVLINNVQSRVDDVETTINDVETSMHNVSNDYDNSDVLDHIKRHHGIIMNQLNDLERKVRDVEFEVSCVKRRL